MRAVLSTAGQGNSVPPDHMSTWASKAQSDSDQVVESEG